MQYVEREAAVVPRRGTLRIDPQRMFKAGQRFFVAAKVGQRFAPMTPRVQVVGFRGERLLQNAKRRFRFRQLDARGGEIGQRRDPPRRQRERCFELLLGDGKAARFKIADAFYKEPLGRFETFIHGKAAECDQAAILLLPT